MYIRIDDREPGEISRMLKDRHHLEISVDHLSYGDYLFSDICIERKTIADFLNSMKSGRLWTQLEGCKENYTRVFLLLEGSIPVPYDKNSAIDELKVISGINGVTMGWGIPIIPSNNITQTARILDAMFRKADGTKKEYLKPVKKKGKNTQEIKENILACSPGVGRGTAKRIIKQYGSIENVVNLSLEDLQKIKGVGEKTAQSIYDAFHN